MNERWVTIILWKKFLNSFLKINREKNIIIKGRWKISLQIAKLCTTTDMFAKSMDYITCYFSQASVI